MPTTIQLSALYANPNGYPVVPEPDDLTWTSETPDVVTVDPTGLATAVARGLGRIRVEGRGFTAYVVLPVVDRSDGAGAEALVGGVNPGAVPGEPVSGTLTPNPLSVPAGTTRALALVLLDVDENPATVGTVEWGTVEPGVFAVDADGLVTGVAPGEASVYARVTWVREGDPTPRALLVVLPGDCTGPVASVEVLPDPLALEAGEEAWLTIYARDTGGRRILPLPPFEVASDDEDVASTTAGGSVVGEGPGVATITVTVEGVTGATTATVTGELAEVVFLPGGAVALDDATPEATFAVAARDALGTVIPGVDIAVSLDDPLVGTLTDLGDDEWRIARGLALGATLIRAVAERNGIVVNATRPLTTDATVLFKYVPGMNLAALGATTTRTWAGDYVDALGATQSAPSGAIRDNHWIGGERYLLVTQNGPGGARERVDFPWRAGGDLNDITIYLDFLNVDPVDPAMWQEFSYLRIGDRLEAPVRYATIQMGWNGSPNVGVPIWTNEGQRAVGLWPGLAVPPGGGVYPPFAMNERLRFLAYTGDVAPTVDLSGSSSRAAQAEVGAFGGDAAMAGRTRGGALVDPVVFVGNDWNHTRPSYMAVRKIVVARGLRTRAEMEAF